MSLIPTVVVTQSSSPQVTVKSPGPQGPGAGNTTLATLTDVNIPTPTDKQGLLFDTATGKWKAVSIPLLTGAIFTGDLQLYNSHVAKFFSGVAGSTNWSVGIDNGLSTLSFYEGATMRLASTLGTFYFLGSSISMKDGSGSGGGNIDLEGGSVLNAANLITTSRTISTTAPLAGGGALSSNLTLSIPKGIIGTDGYLAGTDAGGIVPVGAIIAFAKSFTNTPTLPAGYVECNGQVLSDAGSVYNTQTIPAINTATKRFLRGSTTSGTTGGSDTHTHSGMTVSAAQAGSGLFAFTSSTPATGAPSITPPVAYYEVVYVMRIK